MDLKGITFENKGVMLVLLTAVISGFSIFINSIGVKEFDSSVFAFLKNLVVAGMLLAIILAVGNFSELKKLKRKNWLQLIIIGLVGGSMPFLLYFKGLQMTTGATSGFIHKTLFIYVTIFALIFLKEKLIKEFFIGALLLSVGNYLMLRPDFNFSTGHLLVFIAVLFWAAENTYAKHVIKEIPGTIIAFGRMFFGCIFMLVFLFATEKINLIGNLASAHVLWILLTAIFLLGYNLTFYNGLKFIKVTTAASVLSLGQLITMILSLVFKGKAISVYQIFGVLLIIAGVMFVIWFSELSKKIRMTSGVENGWG